METRRDCDTRGKTIEPVTLSARIVALDAKESAQADGGEKGKPAPGLVISRAQSSTVPTTLLLLLSSGLHDLPGRPS